MTAADQIISRAMANIGLPNDATADQRFARIYELIAALREINEEATIAVGTTGTISDRICGWALETVGHDFYYRLTGQNTRWLGDYALLGFPLNLIVSVKSFKAKERLHMSGTGSQLVPTIGFGLFDAPAEFSPDRLVSYRMRGFLAIYMPNTTLDSLQPAAKVFRNWNGSIIPRSLEKFPTDLKNSLIKVEMGGIQRDFVDPLRI